MTTTTKTPRSTNALTFETIGQNVEAAISGKHLYLRIDVSAKGAASASGKSVVLATTRGNVTVPGGNGAKLGLNLYRPTK